VLGPHRQAGEAEPAQQLADRARVQIDLEAGLDQRLEVDPPPADHAVPRRVRSLPDDRFQFPHRLGREARLAPRLGPVVQAGEPFRVATLHPVAQRLSIQHRQRRCSVCAAASRELPSSTSMRRAAAAPRQRTAARRSSGALSSRRVTVTVIRISPAKPQWRINDAGLWKAPARQTREIGPLV
jgi:hypothetical protein